MADAFLFENLYNTYPYAKGIQIERTSRKMAFSECIKRLFRGFAIGLLTHGKEDFRSGCLFSPFPLRIQHKGSQRKGPVHCLAATHSLCVCSSLFQSNTTHPLTRYPLTARVREAKRPSEDFLTGHC